MHEMIQIFVMLFAVIDPIGTLPVFLGVTRKHPEKEKRKIALQAVTIAGGILIFFALVGQHLLEAINVPLSAFRIAGGIVLFIFAGTMIFGDGKPGQELKLKTSRDTAIFPLAMPSIASPGAMMAMVLLTDNHRFSIVNQIVTICIMIIILCITYLLLKSANRLHKIIGDSGANIISRIMGLILASIATTSILQGIQEFFNI